MNSIRGIIKHYNNNKVFLLEILHDIQHLSGNNFISNESVKEIASALNTTQAHVYGVISYYSLFSLNKRGKNIIRVCDSPVCCLTGSEGIIKQLENILKIKCGQTTADGLFTLEPAECLGICDLSPAMMINQEIYGNLDNEKILDIIETYKK